MLAFDPAFLDDSRWPRLLLRLPGTLSSPGHEQCLTAMAHHVRRGERFILVVDLSRVTLVPLEQRWRQVEWLEEFEGPLRQWLIGTAIVITSPLVRLSVSAIMHFKRLPLPLHIAANLNEADAWVAERLQEAGLTQAPPKR